ncbi:MAG TPA: (Fe-S)-binding protein, partial [Tepidisphaeraceae bacterium]|nr:(Fe-S)-binding protein [Tepidisphaeraceae bacterium]
MVDSFDSIAQATYWAIQGRDLFLFLHLLGLACFTFILARRLKPFAAAQRDPRFDRPLVRLGRVLQYWFGQWRHPRYRFAGVLHILIFAGFLILASRASTLLAMGISDRFAPTESGGVFETVRAYAATVVFLCMVVAAVRRLLFRPARYPQSLDAIFLLALIATLMFADAAFEASRAVYQSRVAQQPEALAVFSLPWLLQQSFSSASVPALRGFYQGAYLLHEFTFFFLLCYRPFGIQFHVETSLFSIYFAKLTRGTVKPARWGVAEDAIDQAIGVKKVEDFTWKHILDFYSCADCGRCADRCPSHAVGRALAPRSLTVRMREHVFERYPVFGVPRPSEPLVGGILSEDEIWSCTTCGACEAECPLLIEYIDKIVDLRRGLIDDGKAPQSLHKPLKALESRGNPFGKLEKKRAEWAQGTIPVANGGGVETLYFVDSITSYDDRIQSIGRATGRLLGRLHA